MSMMGHAVHAAWDTFYSGLRSKRVHADRKLWRKGLRTLEEKGAFLIVIVDMIEKERAPNHDASHPFVLAWWALLPEYQTQSKFWVHLKRDVNRLRIHYKDKNSIV